MINLPPQLTPSALLCFEGLTPLADKRLNRSRVLRNRGELEKAESLVMDVVKASQKPDTRLSLAAAMVHLADVHREMGKLGPMLADCQEAHSILQHQPSRHRRYHEALVTYALGLVHQLLGNDEQALTWYQSSHDLFERVKRNWAISRRRVEICLRIQSWMEKLSEYIATRSYADANLSACVCIPIILSEGKDPEFAIAEMSVDRYMVDRQLTVNGNQFDAYRLGGTQLVSLKPGVEYYARKIPDEARGPLEADREDYMLMERGQETDQEGPGVVEKPDGPMFGHFKRDDEGNVTFTPVGEKNTKVIGGEEIGYVTGLLKPTQNGD